MFVVNASGRERVLHELPPNDASGLGISSTGGALQSLSIAVAPTVPNSDTPYVAWTESQPESLPGLPQVYVRHDQDGSTATPKIPGDLNRDRQVSTADVDIMRKAVRAGFGPYDLDGDGQVGRSDLEFLVETIMGARMGDANLDRRFNSADIILIFQAGQYEDGIAGNSTWAAGDWNGDDEFSTADLIYALQRSRYEGDAAVTER